MQHIASFIKKMALMVCVFGVLAIAAMVVPAWAAEKTAAPAAVESTASTLPAPQPVSVGGYVLPGFMQDWFSQEYLARAEQSDRNVAASQHTLGIAHNWQWGLQEAASPVKEKMEVFFNYKLFWMMLAITIFVLLLLIYVMWRFNAKANPVPSKTTHNVPLEIIWTLIPVVILVIIAIPSFRILYFMDVVPKTDMTVKVTGHQWYWEYAYPDNGGFSYTSNMIPDKEIKAGQHRLLDVDNPLVVPEDTNVRVLVAAADVLHGFFIPSFGVHKLAIPGRIDEAWFSASEPGMYYGQCSKICGVNHGYMPIAVKVLSKDDFAKWTQNAAKEFGALPAPVIASK